jgi:hypothetical protein
MIQFRLLNTAVVSAFAEPATITGNAGPVEARGIFDSRHFEVQSAEGDVGISELVTTLAVDLTETGPVAVGDTVVVRAASYRVKDMRPDGQGMTVLELEIEP